jgi:ubiquitin-protein ligase
VTAVVVCMDTNTMSLTSLARRRILNDTLRVHELREQGIYWVTDEVDLTHGWATVCGTENTPYYGGFFCFEVQFPKTYPFEPPVFTYLTNDESTRFNPNLYRNGKVCLSVLNTWRGEQWSGIQTLSSVLQCIQTAVLTESPLTNEPSYPPSYLKNDESIYNRLLFHAVLRTAILSQLRKVPAYIVPIYDDLKLQLLKSKTSVLSKAIELSSTFDGFLEELPFFHMKTKYKFAELAAQLSSLCDMFEKENEKKKEMELIEQEKERKEKEKKERKEKKEKEKEKEKKKEKGKKKGAEGEEEGEGEGEGEGEEEKGDRTLLSHEKSAGLLT